MNQDSKLKSADEIAADLCAENEYGPFLTDEMQACSVGFLKGIAHERARSQVLLEAMKEIICNGPMSVEEHSERAERIATDAIRVYQLPQESES